MTGQKPAPPSEHTRRRGRCAVRGRGGEGKDLPFSGKNALTGGGAVIIIEPENQLGPLGRSRGAELRMESDMDRMMKPGDAVQAEPKGSGNISGKRTGFCTRLRRAKDAPKRQSVPAENLCRLGYGGTVFGMGPDAVPPFFENGDWNMRRKRSEHNG